MSYYATPFSYGLNVQGLWSSWLPLVDKSSLLTSFGKGLSGLGCLLGAPQLLKIVVVIASGDTENLTAGEIMSSASTAYQQLELLHHF